MTLDEQFMTMLVMILCGIYLGIALETHRRLKPQWQANRFLLYFMEIVFWMFQVVIIFYILFLVNAGELRVYVFLALFLGFAAYQGLAAPVYKRVLETAIQVTKAIYRFLERVVQTLLISPIKFIVQALATILVFLSKLVISIFSFLIKTLFAPLKWIGMGVYRILPKKVQEILRKTAGIFDTIKNICIKGWEFIKRKRR